MKLFPRICDRNPRLCSCIGACVRPAVVSRQHFPNFQNYKNNFVQTSSKNKNAGTDHRAADAKHSPEDTWGWEEAFQPVSQNKGRTPSTFSQPEGTRPASDYNWGAAEGSGKHADFFSGATERSGQKEDNRSSEGGGDWGGDDNWESVEAEQGLSKAEIAKKKREDRQREMEAKRAERRAAKGPLKLGVRKLD